ncbi:MAG TPA: secretin N-terminal domain-containing protein [Phycisphaerae bacterium]|nr:secretin N-terminal domain-containing protein [Phycisphaerae bacterium]HRW55956.1 secretin N-terminal domain-containing protein [Phycisphaerae bacterium]
MSKRIVVLLCLFAITSPGLAQNGRDAGRQPANRGRGRMPAAESAPKSVCVIPLRFTYAEEAATTISQAIGITVVPEVRSNSVIITATAETVDTVKQLIKDIDVEKDDAIEATRLTTITVRNREVKQVVAHLAQLFGRELSISADEGSRQILLRGPASVIESAKEVIQSIDKAPPTATVEFAYFQLGSHGTEFSMEIPPDLKPVAEQIERFGSPRLVGRMTTAAVEGQHFSLQGQIAESTFVKLQGRLVAAPAQGAVTLELGSDLSMQKRSEDEKRPGIESPRFSLATTVITQRGDYVVLGSAPLGWAPGESVVLVVRINPANE